MQLFSIFATPPCMAEVKLNPQIFVQYSGFSRRAGHVTKEESVQYFFVRTDFWQGLRLESVGGHVLHLKLVLYTPTKTSARLDQVARNRGQPDLKYGGRGGRGGRAYGLLPTRPCPPTHRTKG